MKTLVADAGPILHLHEANGLEILAKFGRVSCPPVVLAEVQIHAPGLWTTGLPPWFAVVSLSAQASQRAQDWRQAGLLHAGEAGALAMACEVRPEWFLTDAAAARLMAESLGLEAHGSLGLVLWAASTRLIGKPDAERLLGGLENSSLWLSPLVRHRARAALAAIYLQ